MLYGKFQGTETVVCAADEMAEFEKFKTSVDFVASGLFADQRQPSPVEVWKDQLFSKLKLPPIIFKHTDADQQQAFADKIGLNVQPDTRLVDRHSEMIASVTKDAYAYDPREDQKDNRTIAEIHGLDQADPWDKRSNEEKALDEHFKKQMKEAEKAGKLSSDSWGGGKKPDGARVTEVNTTVAADGSVEIDNIRAIKGLHSDNTADLKDAQRRAAMRAEAVEYAEKEGRSADPKDWIFCVIAAEGDTELPVAAVLCEREFFAQNGHLDDREATALVEHALPDHMSEVMEGYFEFSGSVGDLKADLTKAGFSYSEELEVFLSEDGNRGARDDEMGPIAIDEPVAEEEQTADPALVIDPTGENMLFYKVEVTGAGLVTTNGLFDEAMKSHVEATCFASRDVENGCWFAFKRSFHADKLQRYLAALGLDIEKAFGVDHNGERLVPKGAAEVVDVPDEKDYGPRPWNDRAAEWHSLTEEERAEAWKKLKGEEFLYCGAYRGPDVGCVITIVPAEWFAKHGTMWETTSDPKALDIASVLPMDLKEFSPGVYVTKSRGWNELTFDLARRGFRENLFLKLHLNVSR